jgi:hypothetical protein
LEKVTRTRVIEDVDRRCGNRRKTYLWISVTGRVARPVATTVTTGYTIGGDSYLNAVGFRRTKATGGVYRRKRPAENKATSTIYITVVVAGVTVQAAAAGAIVPTRRAIEAVSITKSGFTAVSMTACPDSIIFPVAITTSRRRRTGSHRSKVKSQTSFYNEHTMYPLIIRRLKLVFKRKAYFNNLPC